MPPHTLLAQDFIPSRDRTVLCGTCELDINWVPVRRDGWAYCCEGCAAGGPCACSYDEAPYVEEIVQTSNTMTLGLNPRDQQLRITPDAFRRLEAEIDRLSEGITTLQADAYANGVSGEIDSPTLVPDGGLHVAAHRLETLRRVVADARVIEPDGTVVIGSNVRVRHADGEVESYELVAAGESDPRSGRISHESPLGAALLGKRVGDITQVSAPAGVLQLAVEGID